MNLPNLTALRRPLMALLVAGLGIAATGCATVRRAPVFGAMPKAPVVPPTGWIFTDIQAPMDYDLNNNGQSTPLEGLRKGSSEVMYINPWPLISVPISFGDASIQESAGAGNISTVEYADYEYFNVIGVYSTMTVNAYGQ